MTILALDIGRRLGWARSNKHCGELALTGGFLDDADAYIAFSRWLTDQLSEDRPEALLIERTFFTTCMRDADFTSGLIRLAHMIARTHDVPRRELAVRTARKVVFGRAGVSAVERIRLLSTAGWPVDSDREADAAALLLADAQRPGAEQPRRALTAAYWWTRAERCWSLAESLTDQMSKRTMAAMAESYCKLAERAERRTEAAGSAQKRIESTMR